MKEEWIIRDITELVKQLFVKGKSNEDCLIEQQNTRGFETDYARQRELRSSYCNGTINRIRQDGRWNSESMTYKLYRSLGCFNTKFTVVVEKAASCLTIFFCENHASMWYLS